MSELTAIDLLREELRTTCAKLQVENERFNALPPSCADSFIVEARCVLLRHHCRALGDRLMRLNALTDAEIAEANAELSFPVEE